MSFIMIESMDGVECRLEGAITVKEFIQDVVARCPGYWGYINILDNSTGERQYTIYYPDEELFSDKRWGHLMDLKIISVFIDSVSIQKDYDLRVEIPKEEPKQCEFHRELITEPLFMEPEDWTEEEWKKLRELS